MPERVFEVTKDLNHFVNKDFAEYDRIVVRHSIPSLYFDSCTNIPKITGARRVWNEVIFKNCDFQALPIVEGANCILVRKCRNFQRADADAMLTYFNVVNCPEFTEIAGFTSSMATLVVRGSRRVSVPEGIGSIVFDRCLVTNSNINTRNRIEMQKCRFASTHVTLSSKDIMLNDTACKEMSVSGSHVNSYVTITGKSVLRKLKIENIVGISVSHVQVRDIEISPVKDFFRAQPRDGVKRIKLSTPNLRSYKGPDVFENMSVSANKSAVFPLPRDDRTEKYWLKEPAANQKNVMKIGQKVLMYRPQTTPPRLTFETTAGTHSFDIGAVRSGNARGYHLGSDQPIFYKNKPRRKIEIFMSQPYQP